MSLRALSLEQTQLGKRSGVGTEVENRRPRFLHGFASTQSERGTSCNLTPRFRTGILTCSAPPKLLKHGLAPSRARDVVCEMEYDLQQIWGATVSNHYKAYAILIPNKQNKWLV